MACLRWRLGDSQTRHFLPLTVILEPQVEHSSESIVMPTGALIGLGNRGNVVPQVVQNTASGSAGLVDKQLGQLKKYK